MYLYIAEAVLEPLAKSIYQALRELRYPITLTNKIDTSTEELYLITGGEYLVDVPKRYIVIQTIPTSPLTLTQRIEAYWISQEYLQLLKGSLQIWDVSDNNCRVWREFYGYRHAFHLPLGYQSILVDTTKPTYTDKLDQDKLVFITNNSPRAQTMLEKEFSKNPNVTTLDCSVPSDSCKILQESKGTVVLLNDYSDTYSPVHLAIYYRSNHIPCIVETGLDTGVAKSLESIGCHTVNRHRLIQYLKDYTRDKRGVVAPMVSLTKSIRAATLATRITQDHQTYLGDPTTTVQSKSKRSKKRKVQLELYHRKPIPTLEHELLADGGISVKLGEVPDEQLPMLSVCTPTGNRRHLFALALRNFQTFIYPRDKLEWIILDDGDQDISDIIPRDDRIHYYFIGKGKTRLPIGEKRNRMVELAKGEIIAMMDDDDFYSTQSLLSRAKTLLKYRSQGVRCVGSCEVASYDLRKGYCAICSNGSEYFTESSLAFTREFWEERGFRPTDTEGEYRYFLEYRQAQLRDIPFQFVTVALTHGSNTTGGVRDLDLQRKWRPSEDWEKTKELMNSVFDEETQGFLVDLRKQLPT
jgi:hypothetical protein